VDAPRLQLPFDVRWRRRLLPRDDYVHRVGRLLPPGYDAYARIFHPFIPWDWGPDHSGPPEPRRTWRSLAEAAGVRYTAELFWRQLDSVLPVSDDKRPWSTWEGEMEKQTAAALLLALDGPATRRPYLFAFGIEAIVKVGEQLLLAHREPDVEAVRRVASERSGSRLGGPEAIWPIDERWIVVSDYDLTSTYVAMDAEGAERVRSTSYLEVLPVDLNTRIAGS
jgi:hypothetical protein